MKIAPRASEGVKAKRHGKRHEMKRRTILAGALAIAMTAFPHPAHAQDKVTLRPRLAFGAGPFGRLAGQEKDVFLVEYTDVTARPRQLPSVAAYLGNTA